MAYSVRELQNLGFSEIPKAPEASRPPVKSKELNQYDRDYTKRIRAANKARADKTKAYATRNDPRPEAPRRFTAAAQERAAVRAQQPDLNSFETITSQQEVIEGMDAGNQFASEVGTQFQGGGRVLTDEAPEGDVTGGVEVTPSSISEESATEPAPAPATEEAGSVRGSQIDYVSDNPFQPGDKGQMRLYSGSDALNDPQAKDLARQAAAGEINTAQYNAGLKSIRQAQESGQGGGGDNASRLADNISRIEGELARPGRGANQSLNDMLTEARVRKNKRRNLNELYSLQKGDRANQSAERRTEAQAQSASADRTSREKIAEQKGIVTRNKAARAEAVRTEQETYKRGRQKEQQTYDRQLTEDKLAREAKGATTKQRADADKHADGVINKMTDEKFDGYEGPDKADRKIIYKATQQEKFRKDFKFDTVEGKLARGSLMKTVVKVGNQERGLWDWINPGSRSLSADEAHKIDFKNWQIGKGEIITGDGLRLITGSNAAIRQKAKNEGGEGDNYIYLNDLPSEYAYLLQKLVMADNPADYVTKQSGIRTGQK